MANLLWTYFQVAPLIRKNKYSINCATNRFFNIVKSSESLLEGIVISELVNVERPIKMNRILAAFVANHKKQVFTHISLTCEQKYIAKKKYHAPQMNNSSLKNSTKSTTFLWPFSMLNSLTKIVIRLTDNSFIKKALRWINKQNWLQNTINCFSKQKTKFFSFFKKHSFHSKQAGSIFETISWETLLEYIKQELVSCNAFKIKFTSLVPNFFFFNKGRLLIKFQQSVGLKVNSKEIYQLLCSFAHHYIITRQIPLFSF